MEKPNIVFILADDLGYGDVGCFGQTKIHTPNIDRLAAEGMRFTQHYSGNAVCAPSRCVLMTGKHPGHAYVRDNRSYKPEGQEPLPADTITLPRLLASAGYVTGGFGKWGLGGPTTTGMPLNQGFNHFFGYTTRASPTIIIQRTCGMISRRFALANPGFLSTRSIPPGRRSEQTRKLSPIPG